MEIIVIYQCVWDFKAVKESSWDQWGAFSAWRLDQAEGSCMCHSDLTTTGTAWKCRAPVTKYWGEELG